jgi:hypothetical protein
LLQPSRAEPTTAKDFPSTIANQVNEAMSMLFPDVSTQPNGSSLAFYTHLHHHPLCRTPHYHTRHCQHCISCHLGNTQRSHKFWPLCSWSRAKSSKTPPLYMQCEVTSQNLSPGIEGR